LELTGYQYDEILGKRVSELEFWADPGQRDQYTNLLSHDGNVKNMEIKFRIKSGEIRDALLSGEIFDLNDGKYILSVIRDITEHKKAAEALRENEERYRLISSVVSDYIFTSKLNNSGEIQLSWVTGAF